MNRSADDVLSRCDYSDASPRVPSEWDLPFVAKAMSVVAILALVVAANIVVRMRSTATAAADASTTTAVTATPVPFTPPPTVPSTTFPTAVPPDAFATPGDPTTAVDLPTAERVFRALYGVRSAAVHAHRADTLQLIETGAALEYDLARCALGCPTPPVTDAGAPHTFSAPAQSGYPAFFAARVSRYGNAGQPVYEIVVFARASQSEPWLVALDDATEGNQLLDDNSADLFRPPPTLPGPAPDALPTALADDWQHWWDTGTSRPDSPIFMNEGVRERGSRIFSSHDKNAGLGQNEERTYAADPAAGVFTVAAIKGQALTCGVVRVADRYTPGPGRTSLEQDWAQTNWGQELAPGRYREIDVGVLEQDCFLTGVDGVSQLFYVDPLQSSTRAVPL